MGMSSMTINGGESAPTSVDGGVRLKSDWSLLEEASSTCHLTFLRESRPSIHASSKINDSQLCNELQSHNSIQVIHLYNYNEIRNSYPFSFIS